MQVRPEIKKLFENEYGYFDSDTSDFVFIRPDTPRPWINILANEQYGCVFSQAGSGFSWKGNSQLARLNRWEQDLVRDEWGRYLYVKDNESGDVWSADWLPCRTLFDQFELRYSPSKIDLKTRNADIEMVKTVFVPLDDPIEIWKVTLTNRSEKERDISLTSYFDWQLGGAGDTHREFHRTFIHTSFLHKYSMIYSWKEPNVPDTDQPLQAPFSGFHAVFGGEGVNFETDKEAFLGRYGNLHSPEALLTGEMKGEEGRFTEPIAVLQQSVKLAAGESKTVLFLTGSCDDLESSCALVRKYSDFETVDHELGKRQNWWKEILSKTEIDTPDEAMNLLVNTWLKHQSISGRMMARCGYYQQSGAYGFRDQLQDSQLWLSIEPERTKKQILLHASQQFVDGAVKHWWHPNTNIYALTHHCDTPLWLPFITLSYLMETADFDIFDTTADYLPNEESNWKVTSGTLLEHCLKSIDWALGKKSERGLPLIGGGDWNDGLSHAGLKGKGESVWMVHFLVYILDRFSQLSQLDAETKDKYMKSAMELRAAVNEHGWDGEWYIAATKDDGKPLGSKDSPEGQIYLNAQTWAVISNVGDKNRQQQAMNSAKKHLFKEYGPLLLTPAYTHVDPAIGYLSRYAPGIRENGGVYTHAATWAIWALCLRGEGNLAWDTFKRLSPPRRAENSEIYYAEPFATPGNIDGPESTHFGRGGWTWYTGSSAWLYKMAIDQICGGKAEVEGLRISPCIPAEWKHYSVKRYFRGSTYNITVSNPNGVQKGVIEIKINGEVIKGIIKTSKTPGEVVNVDVLMG